LAEYNFQVLIT